MTICKRHSHYTRDIVGANIRISRSGVPNFIGERIKVQSTFNLVLLDRLLAEYHDKRLMQFLMYGFPIDHNGGPVSQTLKNHQGAGPEFQNEIQEYLNTEIREGANLGLFAKILFVGEVGISPMNSVPKKESGKKRVILDLSFPAGK